MEAKFQFRQHGGFETHGHMRQCRLWTIRLMLSGRLSWPGPHVPHNQCLPVSTKQTERVRKRFPLPRQSAVPNFSTRRLKDVPVAMPRTSILFRQSSHVGFLKCPEYFLWDRCPSKILSGCSQKLENSPSPSRL